MFVYDAFYALAQPPRTSAVNTGNVIRRKKNIERKTGVKMAVNDFRILCEVSLRSNGTISASKLILFLFGLQLTNAGNILHNRANSILPMSPRPLLF